jgi:hypothetical protein
LRFSLARCICVPHLIEARAAFATKLLGAGISHAAVQIDGRRPEAGLDRLESMLFGVPGIQAIKAAK